MNVDYHGDSFPLPPDPAMTPYQYFKSFLDYNLIDLITEQTNIYSLQESGVSIALTQIEQHIGMLIMIATVKFPRK